MNLRKRIRTPWPWEDLVDLLVLLRKHEPPKSMDSLVEDLKRERRIRLPNRRGTTPTPLSEVIQKIVTKIKVTPSGCWEIEPSSNHDYPSVRLCGVAVLIHRLVWVLCKSSIPESLLVCHHCDNPKCCEPDHLFIGTHDDNNKDKTRKGRCKTKLTNENVREIKRLLSIGVISRNISARFGVSDTTINFIRQGKIWKEVA